jgi:hypothetical protein
MVNEVETILNEIRDRVRADAETRSPAVSLITQQEDATSVVDPNPENKSRESEPLARVSAHLTTTGRAWDKLPPVFSNRTGATARLELWVKTRLKSLSRWFTWEQVNFNAAVHHALVDTLEALSAQERQLIRMRVESARESEQWRQGLEQANRELEELRAEIRRQALSHADGLKAQSAATEAHLIETRAAQAQISTRLSEMANETSAGLSQLADKINLRLAELATDLHEEQRVCFKQLSLETSEAAVLEDRGRRAIESRLKKLEQPQNSSED